MSSTSWHARINCGRDTGAGFLVTEQHVLTCAHVVAHSDKDPVVVSFAHGGEGEVPARVVAHGGWDGRDTDPGDLAVLELDRPVSLKPAEFATPSDAYGDPPRRLLAYGFPKRYDEGTLAEYRATADQLIAGEWVQLEAWAAHGQPLAPGFSGAAVTLAETGRVVGMVSAAARSPEIRNGRMLPTQIMARYWPRLGDLIPTPDYDQPQKERLRRLVEARRGRPDRGAGNCAPSPHKPAADTQPNRPHSGMQPRKAVPRRGRPPGPPAPPTRLRLAVGSGLVPPLRSTGPVRHPPLRNPPRRLRGRHPTPRRTTKLAAPTGPPHPGPRTLIHDPPPEFHGAHLVTDPRGDRPQRLRQPGLPGRGVRVQRPAPPSGRLPPPPGGPRTPVRAAAHRRGLPRTGAWSPGVDRLRAAAPLAQRGRGALEAQRRRRQPARLLRTARRDGPGAAAQRRSSAQAETEVADPDARPAARLHRIDCWAVGQDQVKLTIDLRRDADMVGFGTPPRADGVRRLFQASLNAAVPVMLWPRSGCRGEHRCGRPADCPGSEFLDRLAEHLADLPAHELPQYVHELRETAYASDTAEPHWAHDLALLWEDPDCLPDPVGYAHNPVG